MDSQITAGVPVDQLEALLQRRLLGLVRDLRVEFYGRALVLRGWTRTYYAKQVAQQAAMESTGLEVLANEIEVH